MKQLFDDPKTLAWAKRATAGIETSNVMLGFLDDHARDSPEYWRFALQVRITRARLSRATWDQYPAPSAAQVRQLRGSGTRAKAE